MALLEIDRNLLQRCLHRKPQAWEDFVDRFLGLVMHVIHHTAQTRSIRLTKQDEEDLAADFFLAVINDDFAILRRFRGESSLATYLTVVARRVVVRDLLKRKSQAARANVSLDTQPENADHQPRPEERISNREEVERLMRHLSGPEASVVRLYHLEGKSYHEISTSLQIAENSIGPTLSRARAKLREVMSESPSSSSAM